MTAQELITTLENKKEQLVTRISAIEADFKKGRSADFSEQTTERENDEVLDEIHHEAKVELKLVSDALQRIEQGNYGICCQCQETISKERLMALPYTDTCINCAN
ncbi:TraR/DksA family transcriptional regulator [Thalassotalea ganghwensis]